MRLKIGKEACFGRDKGQSEFLQGQVPCLGIRHRFTRIVNSLMDDPFFANEHQTGGVIGHGQVKVEVFVPDGSDEERSLRKVVF